MESLNSDQTNSVEVSMVNELLEEEEVFRGGVCSNSYEELKEPLFSFGKVNLDLLSTLYMPTTRKRERERSEGVGFCPCLPPRSRR